MCPFTKTSSPKYAFKLKFNCSFEKFNTCEMFKIAKLVPQKSSEVEISETSAGQSPSHCCLPTEFPIKKCKFKDENMYLLYQNQYYYHQYPLDARKHFIFIYIFIYLFHRRIKIST